MTRIISTHSYRGGTGKSTITANIAYLLAAQGQRVGVVDTDILSPGIHVLFGLDADTAHFTLNDYLWGRCAVEQAVIDVTANAFPAGAPKGGSIHLLPSSMQAGEIARVLKEGFEVDLLNEGFHTLCERLDLDYLLIDTHPGVNEETLLSIAISDTLLLVLRPDHQDYQGTAVTLELARRLDVPQLLLVVNKALTAFDPKELADRIFSAFRTPVAAVLPLNEDLVRLGSSGILAALSPDSDYVSGLRPVADIVQR
ncbi:MULTISPECIES: MinD/ParA family protein [unclassified Xanthobacter]|uniref:MinD/ParA family ATP-binding protein n=1 Tax=unclassified Xanthobacter TaxID=2623496 RepID=UPI001F1C6A1D|nr:MULTISPECIES: MinD/ParA family protein [unclassified Xanthobacter]